MREAPQAHAGARVMITGTGGFIAAHVAALFMQRGYDVVGLDRRPASRFTPSGIKHYMVDLLDRSATLAAVADARPSILLHLAARTDLVTCDIAGYAANIEGVSNLCDAIEAAGTVRRAICTSTQLVNAIGWRPAHDTDYNPATVYGKSKVETERRWRARDGAGATWCLVRPTNIWGPGMNPNYLAFFRLLRRGLYFHIGHSRPLKSYGFVRNSAFQYLALAEAPDANIHRRTFYLADYEPIVLRDWSEAFRCALGGPPIRTIPEALARAVARAGDLLEAVGVCPVPLTTFRLNNMTASYVADMEPTLAVCGSLPYSTLDGVEQTAAWLRELLMLPTRPRQA